MLYLRSNTSMYYILSIDNKTQPWFDLLPAFVNCTEKMFFEFMRLFYVNITKEYLRIGAVGELVSMSVWETNQDMKCTNSRHHRTRIQCWISVFRVGYVKFKQLVLFTNTNNSFYRQMYCRALLRLNKKSFVLFRTRWSVRTVFLVESHVTENGRRQYADATDRDGTRY